MNSRLTIKDQLHDSRPMLSCNFSQSTSFSQQSEHGNRRKLTHETLDYKKN